ncbi:MAG: amino acid adenylation domain-containing protein [Gemmatimonadaceae bacterium]|nr:amino acid adenylation domain-containing protein [Gemmatimonadaceae bacterium]
MMQPTAPALLHGFFTRAAARWPHRVAVDVPPGRLRPQRHRTTYEELDRQSNVVAHTLAPFVQGECIVAILLPRTGAHLYAAQLGVMKAGAAYTCFDLAFPDERLSDTIADAQPAALVTDALGRSRAIAAGFAADRIIDIVELLHGHPQAPPAPTPRWLTPSSLAYVIYTSGTTGRPKGVMIEHRSICNLVQSDLDTFAITPDDRCVQNSSAAYDSSVEELWLGFAAGATIVVMDEDASRLGPDIIGWLRDERVTVFCPPPTQLRATGCENPTQELPGLRFVYVGGEALPQDVADRWARGRLLVNGYGPTECSVTCTRTPITAGLPVTIGLPIHNVQAWIVNEALEPVPDGVAGELVIGGACLARGYWNQPELTAERFPHHPTLGRIYRTGDSAQREPDGTLIYHGRIDAQVKLRGYRVELGAIESALVACGGVREAACAVQEDNGRQTLVACFVPEAMVPVPTAATLQDALRLVLPPYMVPTLIAPIDALPTSIGGKLDRKALPRLEGAATNGTDAAPDDPLERAIAEAVRQVLRIGQYPETTADFFSALGGDSLSSAELVSRLRVDPATSGLDVRDIYEARTIAALAARARGRASPSDRNEAAPSPTVDLNAPVAYVSMRQGLSLLRSLLVASLLVWLLAFKILPPVVLAIGLAPTVLLLPPLALIGLLLWAPLAVTLAVAAKRRLVGTYTPTRVRVWSRAYLPHWFVQQAVKAVPWSVLEGTEYQIQALRALGARIGQRVHIHRGVSLHRGGWDLLDIGDDVTLSQDAAIRIAELDSGHLVFSPVSLGDGVTVGVHAGVGADCVMEAGAMLADNASLDDGTHVPAGERWDGLPAHAVGRAPDPLAVDRSRDLTPRAFAAHLFGTRVALTLALAVPPALLTWIAKRSYFVGDVQVVEWLRSGAFSARVVLIVALVASLSVPLRLIVSALFCRALGRVPDGTFSRWSADYVRVWLKPALVENGSQWLYGTLFWPFWLRLAGARVGRDCEISSLIDTLPESLTIGRKNFFADGIYIGFPRLHRGTVTVASTTFGNATFFGNGVIVPGGQRLPDDILLGICTIADAKTMRPGSAWFGHPPFELPHREVVEYDAQFTFDPTPWRYAVRLFWEVMRFAVPALSAAALLAWGALVVAWSQVHWIAFALLVIPGATLAIGSAFLAFVVITKWVLLGKVQPAMHPLWSSWASRWDLMCLAWHLSAGPIVSQLDGTLMLNALLRATGVKVGRRVVLGSGFAEDLPDPDMLTFEDGCTVDCLFQAHTFEDRVLKMDRIAIRAGATIGNNAVLLYGADIGAGARVAPQSVVLKHERLQPGLRYVGFPTRPAPSSPIIV